MQLVRKKIRSTGNFLGGKVKIVKKKIFASILIGSFFLLGCSRQSSQPADIKYETIKLDWRIEDDAVRELGYTNHCVLILSKTNEVAVDVHSIDEVVNIFGQYGWKLVTTETTSDYETYHLQRQVRPDNAIIIFTEGKASQFSK